VRLVSDRRAGGADPERARLHARPLEQLWESTNAPGSRGEQVDSNDKALFGSSLFAHNTRVGVLSFATGMLAGIDRDPPALQRLDGRRALGSLLRDPLPVRYRPDRFRGVPG
jgi:hypothetical protein